MSDVLKQLESIAPFTGESDQDVQVWRHKFEGLIKAFGSDQSEETKIVLWRMRLEGQAAKWQYDKEVNEKVSWSTLNDWLEQLCRRFPHHVEKQEPGTLAALSELSVLVNESIQSFNGRFLDYLSTIPKFMYTSAATKDIPIKRNTLSQQSEQRCSDFCKLRDKTSKV